MDVNEEGFVTGSVDVSKLDEIDPKSDEAKAQVEALKAQRDAGLEAEKEQQKAADEAAKAAEESSKQQQKATEAASGSHGTTSKKE